MLELRPYQLEALEATFRYWEDGGGNPLVDLATGLGKSVVIGHLIKHSVTNWPIRVLALVHVQELVEQNFLALRRMWPQAPAGIYSAGLGKRDAHHRITFASIQSVFRKADELGPRDLVLIDEAHLVPQQGDGMYRRLLGDLRKKREDMRVAGFTATAYRMDSGRLDQGEDRLFDKIVYSYGIGDGVCDGWLAPLIARAGETEIDVGNVGRRGGEFIPGALEAAANDEETIRTACAEIIKRGEGRRSWLVFCAGVAHAYHVAKELRRLGVDVATITGDTPKEERRRLIADYKAGKIRALTNANVLTTGFDAPATDLIAMLRPTLSTGLYIQMCGRGTRKADGKGDCLVLDFSGNVRRHGPVDNPLFREQRAAAPRDDEDDDAPGERADVNDVRAKECPSCKGLMPKWLPTCTLCGHVFPPPKVKHEAKPDVEVDIMAARYGMRPGVQDRNTHNVRAWSAERWDGRNGTPTLCLTIYTPLLRFRKWVAFEHHGFARTMAERFWLEAGGKLPIPLSVDEAEARFNELRLPTRVMVEPNEQGFHTVKSMYWPAPEEFARMMAEGVRDALDGRQ